MLSRISGNKRAISMFSNLNRSFAKRYYIVNYQYTEDTYYTRIPHREEHQKQLEAMKDKGDTKILGAPNFPYNGNNFIFEIDTEAEDGGFERVEKFVSSDPYVKNNLVTKYNIREFAMKASSTEFDRLSSKFVLRS